METCDLYDNWSEGWDMARVTRWHRKNIFVFLFLRQRNNENKRKLIWSCLSAHTWMKIFLQKKKLNFVSLFLCPHISDSNSPRRRSSGKPDNKETTGRRQNILNQIRMWELGRRRDFAFIWWLLLNHLSVTDFTAGKGIFGGTAFAILGQQEIVKVIWGVAWRANLGGDEVWDG